jgi:two-component system repressor protein LuxO
MNQSGQLVLVIDDDPDFQAIVGWMLEERGYQVQAAVGPHEIGAVLGKEVPQAILLDWHLGDVDGTTLIESLRQQFSQTSIVFVTGYSSPEVAASAIKLGAFDFLTKPLDEGKFTVTIAKAVEQYELLCRLHRLELGNDESGFEGLVGVSPQMRTVYSIIRSVAPTDVNVMICGESGTGKELVASAIHACSDRSAGPFVAQNMASIPAELAEATLFGHEKGAFTGADRSRFGAVGEAAGGTLFLDEITEMPMGLQAKLLRFLQERTYRPVGGLKDLKADARIISATNRDPAGAVREKSLRDDLYYRLNVVPIQLPPLRERDGDIGLLANHVLRRFAKQYGKRFQGIEGPALRLLEAYDWPGNVRQLMHLMQRVVILNDSEALAAHMLPRDIFRESGLEVPSTSFEIPALPPLKITEPVSNLPAVSVNSNVADPFCFARKEDIVPLEVIERKAIARAIDLCGGSAYEAARLLGISSATIYRKIKLYDLSPE